MPRLFTGLPLPEIICQRLTMIREGIDGARWVKPDDMHITLRFFGEVTQAVSDEIEDALAEVTVPPFELEIAGTGSFGGRNPTAIYATVTPSRSLDELNKAHDRIARVVGLDPDPRSFRPHVTLARLRGVRPETVARFLETHGAFRLPIVDVMGFALFSAKPGGGGPYATEAEFPFDEFDGGWSEADEQAYETRGYR